MPENDKSAKSLLNTPEISIGYMQNPGTKVIIMKNKQPTMKSANYGIDGPVELRNLIIIGIAAAGLGVLAHYQILPIQPSLASIIAKFCVFIAVFNLACLLLSIWSSKIFKILAGKIFKPRVDAFICFPL
jgi:hypothetical protein